MYLAQVVVSYNSVRKLAQTPAEVGAPFDPVVRIVGVHRGRIPWREREDVIRSGHPVRDESSYDEDKRYNVKILIEKKGKNHENKATKHALTCHLQVQRHPYSSSLIQTGLS